MRFRRVGTHDPDALELPREVQPIQFAKHSPLKRLNLLLDIIKQHRPKILHDYVTRLQKRYDDLTKIDLVKAKSIDVSELIVEFDHLKEFPILAERNLSYYLEMLQPSDSSDWRSETIEVTQRNQLRAVLCPKYLNIKVLTETMDRREAIELYKTYHDEFMRHGRSSSEDRYETLNDFSARWDHEDDDSNRGLIRIISDVEDGKLYLRKDTCLWADAIEDLDDQELKYYVCCYGDFESARLANKHFVLTMERTIIEGHPYCDSVFHDTRINQDLSHPSDDFFARMEPE
ncbi:MAG: L-2-amino-thiazoline-4-carboxylic acid hydrolase [Candidatus Thorarchaeota archaeon]|nr:MAG: L-2-amino-thiazoline-4-carboxylic acid hydrolase [Candidatus Thorarchaeota archaeon]